MTRPRVSVLMPTFEQAAFLPLAVSSLQAQSVPDWQLSILDDGSEDGTRDAIEPFLADPRIHCLGSDRNLGLGATLNRGLDSASAALIAYLPSDDLYDRCHLECLLGALRHDTVLAWSAMRHARDPAEPPPPYLQLVQVMHRLGPDRWTTRDELESDDLESLFWSKLRARGRVAATGRVTCEWVDHPHQRHKAIRERDDGGLNVFRARYRVSSPLRFRPSDGFMLDEVSLYRRFRERPPTPQSADGLKILLVGELAYNPERVLALEERGHRLFGLWTDDVLGYNTVGPLPFGHVVDVPRDDWKTAVRRLQPDVIYALLNWRAVPLAHAVLEAKLAPFVWHFKEAPSRCMRRGTWAQLVDLCTRSDARIYASEEERQWFELALPGGAPRERTLVLDGDLPKRDWFTEERRDRLSRRNGNVHTVVLGRPVGIDARVARTLARNGIHLHVHGLVRGRGEQARWSRWLVGAERAIPEHVHVHEHVTQERWVRDLSRYDAGWLHRFRSENTGDLRHATWDDLNLPARIPALVAAGVPLLAQRSDGCVVASQRLVEERGLGIIYDDLADLGAQLRDARAMERCRRRVWAQRDQFTFDHHVDRLIALFRAVLP